MKTEDDRKNKSVRTGFCRGFTLMEVIVSVAVFSIGIIGSIGLIARSMTMIGDSIDKIIAGNLAQDGIEMTRNYRDTNWLQGKTESSNNTNSWDNGIDGNSNEKYIKFACVNGDKYRINGMLSGGTEEQLLADCMNNNSDNDCHVYRYYNGASWEASSVRCLSDDLGDIAGYNREIYPGFYRLIHIKEEADYSNSVTVTVKWGNDNYLSVKEILYNWKESD